MDEIKIKINLDLDHIVEHSCPMLFPAEEGSKVKYICYRYGTPCKFPSTDLCPDLREYRRRRNG